MDKFMEWLNIILWVVTPVSSIVLCIAADARKLKIWFESVVITLLCAFGVAFMLSQKTPDNCYAGCSQSFFVPFVAWCCLIGFSILLAMFQFGSADTSKSTSRLDGKFDVNIQDLEEEARTSSGYINVAQHVAEYMGQGGPTGITVGGVLHLHSNSPHEEARYAAHIDTYGVDNSWGNRDNDISIEIPGDAGDYVNGRLATHDFGMPSDMKPGDRFIIRGKK